MLAQWVMYHILEVNIWQVKSNFWLCHLLPVESWTCHFTLLCFSFFICKISMIFRVKCVNASKGLIMYPRVNTTCIMFSLHSLILIAWPLHSFIPSFVQTSSYSHKKIQVFKSIIYLNHRLSKEIQNFLNLK